VAAEFFIYRVSCTRQVDVFNDGINGTMVALVCILEDMTLAGQSTKEEYSLSKSSFWMLMRGSFFVLLFTHQVWAGIICYCAGEIESQSVCRQTIHHPEHIAGMDVEDVDQHSSSSCTDEIKLKSEDDSINVPQGIESCCYRAPHGEVRTAQIALLNPVNAEHVLPVFNAIELKAIASRCIYVLKSPHSRPFYLTHSSLLI
jgi:hypothetical protein